MPWQGAAGRDDVLGHHRVAHLVRAVVAHRVAVHELAVIPDELVRGHVGEDVDVERVLARERHRVVERAQAVDRDVSPSRGRRTRRSCPSRSGSAL